MTTPHNPDAEEALLSVCLQWPDEIDAIAQSPMARLLMFVPPNHSIFCALLSMRAERKPIDLTTVMERLRADETLESVGGPGRLAEIATDVPTKALAGHYLAILEESARLRKIIGSAEAVVRKAYHGHSAADLARDLDSTTRHVMDEASKDCARQLREILLNLVADTQDRLAGAMPRNAISTGYDALDEMTGGMGEGQLWVIGARPSNGKTAFAGNLAANLAKAQIPTAFFSAEMIAAEVATRLLSAESGVDGLKISGASLTGNDMRRMAVAVADMTKWPMMIDDRPNMRLIDIEIGCRRMTRDHGTRVAFVDYLQLLREEEGSRNREDAVRRLSNGLKAIAKDLGLTMVVLAQLNRDADGEPKLKHLRDSGSIEQDADCVALLSLGEREGHLRKGKVDIAKCRGGKIGEIEATFCPELTAFKLTKTTA